MEDSIRGAGLLGIKEKKGSRRSNDPMKHQRLEDISSFSDTDKNTAEMSTSLGALAPQTPLAEKEEQAQKQRQEAQKQKEASWVLEHHINLQHDVEHQMEILSVKKSLLPPWKVAFLGTLAGFWVALSGCFAFSVAGGMEESMVKYMPVLPKLTLGFLAPVAIHFIVIFGGEFFSGNCMFMSVGYLKGRLTLTTLLYNWAACFFWNTVGCLFGVWLFGYSTDIFSDEPQLSFIIAVAESKAKMDPWIVFLRAIPANFMICLAVQMGISAREMLGKIIVLHMPLMVYTVAGFEHAIGNLVIFPLGVMYGADASILAFVFNNLIPAVIGNAIGGCLIGYMETLLFSWDQGMSNSNQAHNHTDAQKRALMQLQIPLATSYTRNKVAHTREELTLTLERLEAAKLRLQALEQRGLEANQSPLHGAAYQAAIGTALDHVRSNMGSGSGVSSRAGSFIMPMTRQVSGVGSIDADHVVRNVSGGHEMEPKSGEIHQVR